jgi:hypothetical protein
MFNMLAGIQQITLGPPLAAIHLDAGRIHNDILKALSRQIAVQPKAIASGLVATEHLCISRQAKAFLGLGDFLLKPRQVSRGHRAEPRLLSVSGREGQLPLCPTKFKRHIQNALFCGTIAAVGRCHVQAPCKKLGFAIPAWSLAPAAPFCF